MFHFGADSDFFFELLQRAADWLNGRLVNTVKSKLCDGDDVSREPSVSSTDLCGGFLSYSGSMQEHAEPEICDK